MDENLEEAKDTMVKFRKDKNKTEKIHIKSRTAMSKDYTSDNTINHDRVKDKVERESKGSTTICNNSIVININKNYTL